MWTHSTDQSVNFSTHLHYISRLLFLRVYKVPLHRWYPSGGWGVGGGMTLGHGTIFTTHFLVGTHQNESKNSPRSNVQIYERNGLRLRITWVCSFLARWRRQIENSWITDVYVKAAATEKSTTTTITNVCMHIAPLSLWRRVKHREELF